MLFIIILLNLLQHTLSIVATYLVFLCSYTVCIILHEIKPTIIYFLCARAQKLHGMGGRRMAVMGLPPVGCLPVQVTLASLLPSFHMFERGCATEQNIDSQAYNAKLQALTSRLQAQLHGSRLVYVDVYTPLMNMITNPAQFGEPQI